MKSRWSGEPYVVRMPFASCRSFTPTGSPCSGPSQFPFASDSSAASACAINRSSGTRVTMALTLGFTRWICFRFACMTSRADSFLLRINSRMSTARMKQISEDELGGATLEGAASADPEGAQSESVFSESKSGVTAADTAAFVPSLSASRRVILFAIKCLMVLLSIGLRLPRKRFRPEHPVKRTLYFQALGLQNVTRRGQGLLRLSGIAEAAAGEITCTAALAACFLKYLFQQSVHVFSNGGMLRENHLAIVFRDKQYNRLFFLRQLRCEVSQILCARIIKNADNHAHSAGPRQLRKENERRLGFGKTAGDGASF